MIDLCTVVFRDEIPTLKYQAQSIDLYCQKLNVRNIYVVLNDDESVINQIDSSWWGSLAHRVLVVPRTAFSTPWVENGWLSQQLFKMLAASISYNDFTMVLDAKTIFIRDVDPGTLVNAQGQSTVGQLDIYPVFEPAQQIVNQLFNIECKKQQGPGGVPFLFHNDTVRSMIAEVTNRTQQRFPRWFQSQGMLTEFILYSGYVQYHYGSLDAVITEENLMGNVVNVSHDETAQWGNKLSKMSDSSTLTVSVHRHAWTKLSVEQQQQYRNLLINRGIASAWEM